jgi:hypothetical protein
MSFKLGHENKFVNRKLEKGGGPCHERLWLGLDILMMGDRGPTEIKFVEKLITWNGENIPCKVAKDLRRIRNVNVADDRI